MGGHNDTCMMFLALLAVWLHLRGWKAGAVVALALSALVKVITAPLAPLYILMTLRKGAGWKEGAWFLARAGLGVAAAAALSMWAARMNPDGLTAQTASAAQFYENNYHELLFKGLRRLLGEPAASIETPMDFRTWWVATNGHAVLHAGTSNKSADLCRLKTGQDLLAVSDEDSDLWLRVYDPANGLEGYVDWTHLVVIDDPPIAETDPFLRRISGWPPDWPTVAEANRLIRVVTWGLFVAFGLLAAWKTTDGDGFVVWGTAFFIAADLLVFTKIWPWYAIWPLALGALKPASAGNPTRDLPLGRDGPALPVAGLCGLTVGLGVRIPVDSDHRAAGRPVWAGQLVGRGPCAARAYQTKTVAIICRPSGACPLVDHNRGLTPPANFWPALRACTPAFVFLERLSFTDRDGRPGGNAAREQAARRRPASSPRCRARARPRGQRRYRRRGLRIDRRYRGWCTRSPRSRLSTSLGRIRR